MADVLGANGYQKHLADVLGANGYPEHIIKSAVRPRREGEPKESPKYTIRVLYVSGLSEDLRRICRRYGIYHHINTPTTAHKSEGC